MNVITKHMATDPNSILHAHLGMIWCLSAIVLDSIFSQDLESSLFIILFSPLVAGILIELVQRLQRTINWKTGDWLGLTGTFQNTFKESVLDVFQTWWFPVTYYILYRTK